nr:hypothetical protein [uncultured bacterium]
MRQQPPPSIGPRHWAVHGGRAGGRKPVVVAECFRAVEAPLKYWEAVDKHWADSQCANGQWAYGDGGRGGGTLSMTAAGTASMFVTQEYISLKDLRLRRRGDDVGREPFSEPLRKALAWFEQGDNSVTLNGSWWGYTLYGIERVGLASGFKYFGTHDWYRELARQVVARQQANGSWGDPIETSYALLFLARGRHPILMNKLRFDGYWANRPRDAANLARFAGRQFERPLNWQVVNLQRDWYDWLDSPILYVASHTAPRFADADYEKLRRYAEAGGLIFTHADGTDRRFDQWARGLAAKLFPKYEMQDLRHDHPVYSVLFKTEFRPRLRAVSNGSRLLMIHSPGDMARQWQARNTAPGQGQGKHLFELGTNLFIYAAGKRDLRNRLDSPHVTPPGPAPLGTVAVARLEYAGNWDPEPAAWGRFARVFQRRTGTGLEVRTVRWRDLRPGLAPFAHVTGTARYAPTAEEAAALKGYLESGGVLLVDPCGGAPAFTEGVEAALAPLFPDAAPRPVRSAHPLINAGPPGMADLTRPRMRPYVLEKYAGSVSGTFDAVKAGRGHVILSRLDLTSGLLGTNTWGVAGYEPAYAQAFIQNAIFWTMDGQVEP